jgi:putative lipoprotein (rSAM/lipoprotein system)
MGKIGIGFIRGTNGIIAALLTLLGFSSCEKMVEEYGAPYVEYGTPYAKYAVSGKITDNQGNNLQKIRVVIPDVIHCTPARPGFIPDNPEMKEVIKDTLYTKTDGSFEYEYDGFPSDTVKINLKFEDASEESVYETDSTTVKFLRSDLNGGKSWNAGKAKKEITVKLNKKY